MSRDTQHDIRVGAMASAPLEAASSKASSSNSASSKFRATVRARFARLDAIVSRLMRRVIVKALARRVKRERGIDMRPRSIKRRSSALLPNRSERGGE